MRGFPDFRFPTSTRTCRYRYVRHAFNWTRIEEGKDKTSRDTVNLLVTDSRWGNVRQTDPTGVQFILRVTPCTNRPPSWPLIREVLEQRMCSLRRIVKLIHVIGQSIDFELNVYSTNIQFQMSRLGFLHSFEVQIPRFPRFISTVLNKSAGASA